jgi:SNF2 family DNA or RNA helicase
VSRQKVSSTTPIETSGHRAVIVLDFASACIRVNGFRGENRDCGVTIRVGHGDTLSYEWRDRDGRSILTEQGTSHPSSIAARVRGIRQRIPAAPTAVRLEERHLSAGPSEPRTKTVVRESRGFGWFLLPREIRRMAEDIALQRAEAAPAEFNSEMSPTLARAVELERRRQAKEIDRLGEMRERMQQSAARQREMQQEKARRAKEFLERQERERVERERAALERREAQPPPVIPIHFAPFTVPANHWQSEPRSGAATFRLLQRASLLWISNQTDDLLCLPHCRIEHLDFQTRTALKVLGPMRGRALLSDEVGLGKTIEAGLVLKECLTRGLVRRFLILTMPSLVDQWQEELEEKFGISAVTTNSVLRRDAAHEFWKGRDAVIASLHTVKQDVHLRHASEVPWDLLIVDEAHHLRNRASKAWQAVNRLPRQFLLLLTATPVQNSLEDLYHLVELLDAGRLPAPQEFRERFIDRERPRQPKAPEELRRLLNQVMIRNTRANAEIALPPRRAETVLFEPRPDEAAFCENWESELRAALAVLPPAQASLRGRILLQAMGSSPPAWRQAMTSFPDAAFAKRWSEAIGDWRVFQEKLGMLPPLARTEGGVVIFTQFLATQREIASSLARMGTTVRLINGQTPPHERQPITDAFRREGGVLVLTQSGTEGRNLQFCHRLVNFDLPWNPMEIEQRIGRLHRIGQVHPVEIFNFVQARSLQALLLELLQEKLNLFELVVGETGLILGERFSSDDFAAEVFGCWNESGGDVAGAFARLGEAVAEARSDYAEVQDLDATLFSEDYETL